MVRMELKAILDSESLINYVYDLIYEKETEYINAELENIITDSNNVIIRKEQYDNELYSEIVIYNYLGEEFLRVSDNSVDDMTEAEYILNKDLFEVLQDKLQQLEDIECIILCN